MSEIRHHVEVQPIGGADSGMCRVRASTPGAGLAAGIGLWTAGRLCGPPGTRFHLAFGTSSEVVSTLAGSAIGDAGVPVEVGEAYG